MAGAAALIGCGDPGPFDRAGPNDLPLQCPTDRASTFDARTIVGESERDAAAIAREHGCAIRVVRRDGRATSRPLGRGHRVIDVAVENGGVVSVRPYGYR